MKRAVTMSICIMALMALFILVDKSYAVSSYFEAQCASCHFDDTPTCGGCHAHGVHSNNNKDDINVVATTDKTNYTPGETITVTVDGGYRWFWVRAILYDENGNEVARSSGPGGTGSGESFPIVLTAPAPSVPGMYTYSASWYGHESDTGGAVFGDWRPDPNNSQHGEEVVQTNQFEVAMVGSCTDADGDGYSAEGGACGPVDCDDTDAAVNPGAIEDCTDGIDNNCNGLVDNQDPEAVNCSSACTDADGDGYSAEGGACGPVDCDDTDAAVNPSAIETCTDGIDNDCNALIDEADPACSVSGSDYDIKKLECEEDDKVGEKTEIKLKIRNQGTSDPGAVLNLYGMRNGTKIPIATDMLVFDRPGGGDKKHKFSYTPTTSGVITWHATLDDGNPDVDEEQCTTVIKNDDDDDDDERESCE